MSSTIQDMRVDEQLDVQDIAWAVLNKAAISKPPTDPEMITEYLGLAIEYFSPPSLAKRLETSLEDVSTIRALLVPEKKKIWINETLSRKRRRFSILHEIAHYILPGHASEPELLRHNLPTSSAVLDEFESEFTTQALIEKEREANEFAAECLFQGRRFNEKSEELPFGWQAIQDLADTFDASFESTARRYVEHSPQYCALVIFRPIESYKDGEQPPLALEYTITSKSFEEKFFKRLKRDQLIDSDNPAHSFFYTLTVEDPLEGWFNVHRTLTGDIDSFHVIFFSNRYKLMALMRPELGEND